MFTCPMHPHIQSKKPGRCLVCGMKLVLEKGPAKPIGTEREKTTWARYFPLIVVIGIIVLTTSTLSLKDILIQGFQLSKTISYFMIGFFLTFSGFKLIDLSGFAQGYYTYDLLAKRWFTYGYIYPFLELFFGLAMIIFPDSKAILVAEIIIMTFSGIGVAIS